MLPQIRRTLLGNSLLAQSRFISSKSLTSCAALSVVGDGSNISNILTVALVGKQNVGKSTLFNRLCSNKTAIISGVPGTTRDRNYGIGFVAGLPLRVIDTGGYGEGTQNMDVRCQIKGAIAEADVIAFIVDGKEGITFEDSIIATWLRKEVGKMNSSLLPSSMRKDVMIIANKTEGAHLSNNSLGALAESFCLGFGEPLFLSASHGEGVAELNQKLTQFCRERRLAVTADSLLSKSLLPSDVPQPDAIQVAIMGRTNVGKSALLNSILKKNRVLSGPDPHLTTDSVLVEYSTSTQLFRLMDTPGLTNEAAMNGRRPANKNEKNTLNITNMKLKENHRHDKSESRKYLSRLFIGNAFRALCYSHVVILTVEGKQGKFTAADLKLVKKCEKEGRALVICANKRDLLASEGVSCRQYEMGVKAHCASFLRGFGDIPVVSTAATPDEMYPKSEIKEKISSQVEEWTHADIYKSSEGIDRLMRVVSRTYEAWSKRIPTSVLNDWLLDAVAYKTPPRVDGKETRIRYITQVKSRPPFFVLFGNTRSVPRAYCQYIRKKLQSDFNLGGVPLRLTFRRSSLKTTDKRNFVNPKKSGSRSKRACSVMENLTRDHNLVAHRKVTRRRSKSTD